MYGSAHSNELLHIRKKGEEKKGTEKKGDVPHFKKKGYVPFFSVPFFYSLAQG